MMTFFLWALELIGGLILLGVIAFLVLVFSMMVGTGVQAIKPLFTSEKETPPQITTLGLVSPVDKTVIEQAPNLKLNEQVNRWEIPASKAVPAPRDPVVTAVMADQKERAETRVKNREQMLTDKDIAAITTEIAEMKLELGGTRINKTGRMRMRAGEDYDIVRSCRNTKIATLAVVREVQWIMDDSDSSQAGAERLNEAGKTWEKLEAEGTLEWIEQQNKSGELVGLLLCLTEYDKAIAERVAQGGELLPEALSATGVSLPSNSKQEDELEQLRRMAFGKDDRDEKKGRN
jgi:hypothetical protein